jgi:two-component system, NarL family, response regulator DevR
VTRRSPIRVLLVDDHGLVRIGIREQLASCQDFSVVGEAASVKQAVELAHSLTPQVVVLDLNLPDGSGIQACRRILAGTPDMHVLIMTICDDSAAVRAAIAAGAHGYVLKDIGTDMLPLRFPIRKHSTDWESFLGKNNGFFRCWGKAGLIKRSASC